MKKLFTLLMIMILALSGCASDSESTSSDTSNVLRVGMEAAYAPFNWTQETPEVVNGAVASKIYGSDYYAYGYDVMVAQKIADDLGMGLEIHKVEWDSIGLGLNSNDYDVIIAGMGKNAERELSYEFTAPYYYRTNVITVRKDDAELANITGISQFAGLKAKSTTQLSSSWVPLLDLIPDIEVGPNYSTTAEVFMAVSNGSADFALIDYPTSYSALLTNTDLKILDLDEDDDFDGTEVCIAVRKGETDLRDKLDASLVNIGWTKDVMNESMNEAIEVQPAAN